MTISTVFNITVPKHKTEQFSVKATGEHACKAIRSTNPKWTKIVLVGFDIAGKFIPAFN